MANHHHKSSEISLLNFFVFNPLLGRKEGEEHKKLLYFHPSSTSLDAKIKVIGLSEAIIRFMETFTESPCESLHTQKTRQLYFRPENDFWIVMTISIPTIQKITENGVKIEYMDDHVIDKTYQAVLEKSYSMFKLFNGSISRILSHSDMEALKDRLEHFFNKYLPTLRLNQSDILDVFGGIHYLPLDRCVYLKTLSLVNRLEYEVKELKHTVILYNSRLVWTGIEQDDMKTLYHFLVTSLYPAVMEQDFHPYTAAPSTTSSSSSSTSSSTTTTKPGLRVGKFILGPPDISNNHDLGQMPQVHLSNGTLLCNLAVYKIYDAVICLFIDGNVTPPFELFVRLDRYFHDNMEELANEFAQYKIKRLVGAPTEASIKYVYFNKANLAQKSCMHSWDGVVLNVSPDVMRLVSAINLDINSASETVEDCETVVKIANDCWVVGKRSDQREVYVIVNQKNANLIDINEEVNKLCATFFNDIFFLD
ncbi:hypothetical protein HELRODRAFT_185317 [Helobdella robusta]|uniref:CCZ1/INTU/HSP4 first Longin domain-containing protein n=1 Tax=Helobdella robusta TaxID=6412 RepID=T1FMN5_HELRO|nr:hypothetical protein HELRODRAFT_185317 [Helobdella robusta]ESO10135.1 hypothetical protein HELRODRAFT_185317 [Helobdella robusta]